jgi:hypothetical protein
MNGLRRTERLVPKRQMCQTRTQATLFALLVFTSTSNIACAYSEAWSRRYSMHQE